MADHEDNAKSPPEPWKRRDPAAIAGEGTTVQQAWSWTDDEGDEHYIAIDDGLLLLGRGLSVDDDLEQEPISLDALAAFLREAGWTVTRP